MNIREIVQSSCGANLFVTGDVELVLLPLLLGQQHHEVQLLVSWCLLVAIHHVSLHPVKQRKSALKNQCSGSMTFWCGSGSADPSL